MKRHLNLVGPQESIHPRTLEQYVGTDDLDQGLRERLGSDALWLVAQDGYGIVVAGMDEADCLDCMSSTYIPVTYVGVRRLQKVEYTDEYRQRVIEIKPPEEDVAVFAIDIDRAEEQWGRDDAHEVLDYAEIAVQSDQLITLLDENEYPSVEVIPLRTKPRLVVDNTRKQ